MGQTQRISRNVLTGAVGRTLGAFFLSLLFAGALQAQSITLAWDPNTESDLAGYIVSYGRASGIYTGNVTVGNTTTYTVAGLTAGTMYFFAVKAYNTSGLQSGYSAEVSGTPDLTVTLPSSPSSPNPADVATGVSASPSLTWSASGATSYTVKLGITNPPAQIATGVSSASYAPASLASRTTYFWQIVATNAAGSTTGPVWSFTTGSATETRSSDFDVDGDGRADLTVYRPSTGMWWTLQSSTNFTAYATFQWGVSGDIAVPGDYDGDGRMDFAVYRPSTGTWNILQSSTNYTTSVAYQWGIASDIPVPGDYDGDGRIDVAVYRPSTGMWYILQSSTNYTTSVAYQWGVAGDIPVPGDYDGDGRADFAVWRPSTGTWYIAQSSTNNATSVVYALGLPTDLTVPGDYDGDGKTDLAVWRPATGTWFVLTSSSNYTTAASYAWGLFTDIPVALSSRPASALITRYRLYSDLTKEHLYTTSTNEYRALQSCCAWTGEGAIYQILKGAVSVSGVVAVPYFRLYNPSSYQHHWTTDAGEYSALGALGWSQEGIDGYILPTATTGTVPLYRLYLNALGGLHLWTTDAREKTALTTTAGWIDEGVAGYVTPLP